MTSEPSSPEIDHSSTGPDAHFKDLHSRNIATMGLETMVKIASLRVLILGCGGIGIETAKNLALAGVHTVSLYDHHHVHVEDLGVNFACTEADIGKTTRAKASARLLQELNPAVRIRVVETKAVSIELLHNHDVVLVTPAYRDVSLSELDRINLICRSRSPSPVSFILALAGGNMANVFCDHGAQLVSRDLDGRPPIQKAISAIEERVDKKDRKYSLVRFETPEGMLPGALRDYTQITFSGVRGLTKKVAASSSSNQNQNTATAASAGSGSSSSSSSSGKAPSVNDNTEGFKGICGVNDPKNTVRVYPSLVEQGYVTPFLGGGFITEVKEQVALRYSSLMHALRYPQIQVTDPMDWTLNNRMHAALTAILLFATAHGHGHLPRVHNKEDAEQAFALFKQWNDKSKSQSELDDMFRGLCTKNTKLEENSAFTRESSTGDLAPEEEEDKEMPARFPAQPDPSSLFLDGEDIPEAFIRRCASLVGVELQPMAAFIGGVVAQEVVKVTGKFTPIQQFLCFDYSPALPSDEEYKSLKVSPRGNRYDNLTQLYGADFTDKLQKLNLFMPGCGALGCEYIKNFALLGVACSQEGKLTVTDNDHIEISNLSRQFLFREDNVGQPKSSAAGARAAIMNKSINVDAKKDFVGSTTEHIFDDAFWDKLDVVVNALDNMPTRLYVDSKCVFHQKILVEAGTTGTAGNVDIVNPGKTTSYGDGGKADETGGIPMCTLRNFPYIFEHCIEWARAQFNEAFVTPLSLTQQIREDPERFVKKMRADIESQPSEGGKLSMLEKSIKNLEQVQTLVDTLTAEQPSMDLCAKLAWKLFHEQFRDRILALCEAFPRDARKSNGDAFWSGHRRFPTPMKGDMSIPEARDFMIATTNLFACLFGIHPEKPGPRFNNPNNRWMSAFRREDWIRGVVSKLGGAPARVMVDVEDLDEDSKKDGDNNSSNNNNKNKKKEDLNLDQARSKFDSIIEGLVKGVGQIPESAKALDFEKDDDDNFHIDFVAAAANLRAKNYDIDTKDRMQVKLIAGKIIPAIATTTAAVCGLAIMEYFKVLLQRDISDLRNGQIDLGCNSFVLFERDPPSKNKSRTVKTYDAEHDYTEENEIVCVPDGFTKYDRFNFEVDAKTTFAQFVDMYSKKLEEAGPKETKYDVMSIAAGKGLLWTGPKHANNDRPLLTVVAEAMIAAQGEVSKKESAAQKSPEQYWEKKRYFTGLVPMAMTKDAADVETPIVTLVIKH